MKTSIIVIAIQLQNALSQFKFYAFGKQIGQNLSIFGRKSVKNTRNFKSVLLANAMPIKTMKKKIYTAQNQHLHKLQKKEIHSNAKQLYQFKIKKVKISKHNNSNQHEMSNQPQQKPSEIVKIIERQNVISFKKKPKPTKDNIKQNNNEEQDTVSAHSSHSGVYSEDVNRFKGKINPLPELGREKKRFIAKNLLTQEFRVNNYQDKEVRQQQNLMLKQKNNFLSSENMKLKTKITTLEKENAKLQKILDEQSSKSKTPGVASLGKQRFRPSGDNLSTKILLKSLKKELQDLKKQNIKIKSSIKFTTITELECERDAIVEQTNRLRAMLEEELNKRLMMKINQQGMSNLEQKLNSLTDKNIILMRENQQLKSKLKNQEDGPNKVGKTSQNEKNLTKTLYNVRRLLKEKQKQVELLKQQVKATSSSINSINSISTNSEKGIPAQQNPPHSQGASFNRKPSMERPSNKNFQKRIVSKSAQKTGPKIVQKPLSATAQCQKCKAFMAQNETLKKKIAEYESAFISSNPLALPTEPVDSPKPQEIEALTRFISFRFKAHHLSLTESQKYLLNSENITPEQLKKEITVEQFLEIVLTQPFVVLNKRYIEVFLLQICYKEELKKGFQKIKLDKDTKITKQALLDNYKKLMPAFELLPQTKQQEMFLQIAELVTSYYQQILAAMSNRKNGEGTISQKDLIEFFIEIQLEKEYIDFIVTQIILESIDLDKLNYFAFFEIFYIPQEEGLEGPQNGQAKKGMVQTPADKKKRFEVDQVVKQQDEEYEESRSHVDQSRQRTISKHDDESGDSYQHLASPKKNEDKNENEDGNEDQENYGEQEYEREEKQPQAAKSIKRIEVQSQKKEKEGKKKAQKDESYAEEFQAQNLNESDIKEENKPRNSLKQKPGQLVEKPYEIEDIQAQYEQEFEN